MLEGLLSHRRHNWLKVYIKDIRFFLLWQMIGILCEENLFCKAVGRLDAVFILRIVSSVGNFLVPLHIAFRSRGPIHFKYSIFNLVCIGNALISGAQDNIHRDTSPSLVEVSYSYNSLNTALKIRDTWKPPWRRNPWTRSSRKHFVLRKPSSNINGCSVAVSGLVLYFRSVCLTEPRCSWLWSSCWLLLLFYYSPGVKGWRTIGIYYLDLSVWAFEVLSF